MFRSWAFAEWTFSSARQAIAAEALGGEVAAQDSSAAISSDAVKAAEALAPLTLQFPNNGAWQTKANLLWQSCTLQAELKNKGDCVFIPAGYIAVPRFAPPLTIDAGGFVVESLA